MLGALIVAWVVAWQIEPWLYAAMEKRINDAILAVFKGKHIEYKIVFHGATEPFLLKLKLSFYIALVLVLPLIVLNIWGFIAPALKPNEQKPFKKLAPASSGFFLLGAGFAYAAVPAMFAWFASYTEEFPGTAIYQEAGSQLFLVTKMMLAFGVAFQLPLIVYGLGLAGVLTAETLLKYWRHGATAIFATAAIVTPSNDPFSMLMMAIPLTALFMGSVYAVKLMEKRRGGPPGGATLVQDPPMAALDQAAPAVIPDPATEKDRETLE